MEKEKVLVLYGSVEGHTAKIAEYIAKVARVQGHEAETVNLKKLPRDLSLNDYTAIIIGAPVYLNRLPMYLEDFVLDNLRVLKSTPSAFFVACLTASQEGEDARVRAEQYVETFIDHTSWQPGRTAVFGGAALYSQYGFFKRLLVKTVHKDKNSIPGPNGDYDYTDWDAVRIFTEEFLGSLRHARVV